MTETDGLRDWIGARGLPPADENVVAYAAQLQKLYGGDAHVIMAAALCTGDPEGALAALEGKPARKGRAPLSEGQIAALKRVLLRLSQPGSRPDDLTDSIEAAIVRDAVLLAELRRPLLDSESIRATGERLESLHCPASRQQAARDYVLSRMLAERTHLPPELEALTLRGYYIVLEGIDGTGKNLQADRLMARLSAVGREVVYHEEPTPRLRKLQAAFDAPSPTVELFLYTADRIEATEKVVRPALEQGKDVVSVRCFMSTMAYQSEHYSPADIAFLSRHVPMPSLILLLDVSPELGLERVAQRQRPATKYERIEQLTRARKRYHEAASLFPQAVIVDAAPPVDAVADSIWEIVQSRLMF